MNRRDRNFIQNFPQVVLPGFPGRTFFYGNPFLWFFPLDKPAQPAYNVHIMNVHKMNR